MKVLHINGGGDTGGGKTHLAALLPELRRLGIDAQLVTFSPGLVADELSALAVPVHCLGISHMMSLTLLRRLRTLLVTLRPDIVHTHGGRANFYGRLAARLTGVPTVVTTVHSHIDLDYAALLPNLWFSLVDRLTWFLVHHFIVVSRELGRTLGRRGIAPERVSVVPNGIAAVPPQPGDIRAMFGTASGPFICAVGRLVPVKRFDVLLRAIARTLVRVPEAKLLLIGDGPLFNELKHLAAQLNISHAVRFTGYRHDARQLLAGCDVFVMSSDMEGLPVVLLEAMDALVPVVATSVGGVPEVVAAPHTGLLVPPSDPESLAEAIVATLTDPHAAALRAQAGKAWIDAHGTARVMAEKTADVYRLRSKRDGAVRTIVLFSAVPWDGIFARPQQLARGFVANGARVLFVEPSASLLAPLKRPELARRPFGSAPRFTEDALAVVTPPLVLPGGYSARAVNKLNQRYLAQFLRGVLAELRWQPTAVLTHLPGTADFPAPWPLAYDCVDDHAAFAELSPLWRRDVVLAMERDLLRRARCVYASSDVLVKHCQSIRPDVRYVGNGAAVAHFAAAARAKSGVSGLQGPVIGYYGGLGPWVDVALVRGAALFAPDLNFLLIGPKEPGLAWPDMPPNVLYKGLTPYSELPRYLADFDVAMIPFKNTPLTQSVNPIKLYEYFAAGKPVLVASIPELTRWEGLVYPFTTAGELVSCARAALKEAPALAAKRQAVAAEHTWEAKVREMESLMRVHGM